ncbi:MAG TPA: lysylphosphatidylglycerol synthase transmembrane domain-containing protein [Spirochaetota bacterium]|nr:lysylphosphatidylglycerol synthase transmembrane domain-containing protein [Spirochaetota bacterium]
MNNKLKIILKIIVTLLLFYFIFKQIKLHSLRTTLANINLLIYLPSLTLIIVIFFLISAASYFIIKKLTGRKVPYFRLMKYQLIARPFQTVTPARSGDMIRALYLKKHGIGMGDSMVAVILERGLQLLVIVILGAGAAAVFFHKIKLAGLFLVLLAMSLMLLNRKTIDLLFKPFKKIILNMLGKITKNKNNHKSVSAVYQNLLNFVDHKPNLLLICLLLLARCLTYFTQIYITFLALGQTPSFLQVIVFSPLVSVIELLPVTISGFGLRENAAIFFYNTIAVPEEATLSVYMLIILYNQIFTSLIGLLVFQFEKTDLKNIFRS